MNTSRRQFTLAAIASALWSGMHVGGANAQYTEQEVRNGAAVTATGDVTLTQDAAGGQSVLVVNGTPITQDGVYRTAQGQVVVNDGRVVATGDVTVEQRASGNQSSEAWVWPTEAGQRAVTCQPGSVLANPHTGVLFFQKDDCCWYPVPCCADSCGGCGS